MDGTRLLNIMPRIILAYKHKSLISTDVKNRFSEAEKFFQSQTFEKTFTKQFLLLDSQVLISIVFKINEENKIFVDQENGFGVFLDGSPIINDKQVSAKDFFKEFVKLGSERLANQIDGSWSAVIINPKESSISIFRDRFGRVPFYFVKSNNIFLASSNSGAIIKTGIIPKRYNENIIARYASSNYMATFGMKDSFFKDISLIDPATFLVIDNNSIIKEKKYWSPDIKANYFNKNDDFLEKEFMNCLIGMTKKYHNINKHENFGVALSGGIDSGAIIGLLHKQHKQRIKSISMTYSEQTPYDETNLISCSVRDHVSEAIDIKIDKKQLLDDLPDIYSRFDTPMPTITAYCHEILFRKAANCGMKVLFTGAGGDALQAGTYPFYLYNLADLKYSDSKSYENELDAWIKNHSTKTYPKNKDTAEEFFSKRIDFSRIGKFKSSEMLLKNNILDEVFKTSAGDLGQPLLDYPVDYLRSYIMQELWYDSNAAFESEDVMCWSHGIKVVSPFFDKKVIDFAWQLPPHYKIKNGINKVLARKALRGIVPNEILDTVSKQGFNGPFDIWIKGFLKEFVMDHLTSEKFKSRGIYNQVIFQKCLQNHMDNKENNMMLLWQALNLELWFNNWIDSN